MAKWKKIVIAIAKWTFLIVYLFSALSFVGTRSHQVTCSNIDITISDSLVNAFVTKSDVMKVVTKQNPNFIGIPIRMINTYEIEKQLTSIQSIKKVDVFTSIDGRLNIHIEQRKPMVRIINRYGQSYYIDKDGQILPLSNAYTSHVLVINGNIMEPFDVSPNIKVMDWAGNNLNDNSPLICKLYNFAQYITADEFWNSQIAQIYVDNPTNIELIPRVGPHTVIFGSLNDYQTKLAKLKLFYERALPEEGWNKYSQINLKFKNQIVCTKR